ncbi:hypothetical protein KXX13_005696 [Aspergillus fumigatus]|nr:hypothetical protein KXX13_005696 [Aspergillus fumigatus]KAH1510705.1 hypothetical protein KXX29_004324 [Aspergillus fumigatus]KAH1562986.1 hypothetical protein KXX17_004304 [Aspergillus fumigatus]KAH1612729.1 hypothetical protein KXX21_002425 [Aspergillus fumigatus]KAH1745059.1 hypothetical protein KXX56_004390 [Aspergillus fumigatus]
MPDGALNPWNQTDSSQGDHGIMISTTAMLDKTRPFSNLEEYVAYRIIDTAAPFVDTSMRFGMNIRLTPEEERRLHRL